MGSVWVVPSRRAIFKFFFVFYPFRRYHGTFTLVFIDKKSKRSRKIVEIEVFCLVIDGRILIRTK
jgi:hypothetical protein